MLELIQRHLFAVLFLLLAAAASAGEQVSQGDLAPNWILADLEGQEASLYEEAEQGKWTVMIFCASWCSNCEALLPKIAQLSKQRGETPVAFYVMNVWDDKDPAAFMQEQGYGLSVVRHAEHVAKRYGISITPGVVVVSPEKRIHYLRQPSDSVTNITSHLQKILKIELPSNTSAAPRQSQE